MEGHTTTLEPSVKQASTVDSPYDPAVEVAMIRKHHIVRRAGGDPKFHHRFIRTLNTKRFEPAVQTNISIGYPFNKVVVNGMEENPIFLLFYTHSTSSVAAPHKELCQTDLYKTVPSKLPEATRAVFYRGIQAVKSDFSPQYIIQIIKELSLKLFSLNIF